MQKSKRRRSECPLNASVEMLGDKWSLLILRDMMLRGARTYKDFLESSLEKIATNILADRLRKLEANGIIAAKPDAADARKMIYTLTQKGIDLAPVLTEMVLWAAKHEHTGNQKLVALMRKDKEGFLAEVRQRLMTSVPRSDGALRRQIRDHVPFGDTSRAFEPPARHLRERLRMR